MARARSPNREKAKELYINSKGNIKLIDIAKELGIKDSQIRKWKSQDKWDDDLKGALPNSKGSAPFECIKKNNENNITKKHVEEVIGTIIENAELTDKQRLFCIYYIKYFNATKAYKKAYKCNYNVANVEGHRHLVKPSIQNEIARLKAERFNRAMLSEDDIFQKYIDIAFSDITDYVQFGRRTENIKNELGDDILNKAGEPLTTTYNYVDFINYDEVDGTIISEVSNGKNGIKVKLQDKMKALQWLSDRMELLSTETKIKLENEKSKLELDVMKLELDAMKHDGQDEEIEDDGFMEALKCTVGDIWNDD